MENPEASTQPGAPQQRGLLSSVRGRLWLMIAVSGAVALMLWSALFYLAAATRRNDTAIAAEQVKSQFIAELAAQAQQLNAPGNNVLEKYDVKAERGNFNRSREEYRRFIVRANAALLGDGALTPNFRTVQAEIEKMNRLTETILSAAEGRVQAAQAGKRDSAGELGDQASAQMAQMDQAFHRASRALREMEVTERERIRKMLDDAAAASRLLSLVSLALLVVALGAIAGLGFWLLRSITRPLDETRAIAASLATGDLTARFTAPAPLEISEVQQAMQSLIDYLHEMADLSDRIAAGELKVEVQPRSEADRFGHAFQNMLERTLKLVQSQEERDEIQRSIMRLLAQVSEVAQGDLSREAEVTADLTGALADSFNFMTTELRRIIGKVQDVTEQVTSAASATVRTAEEVAEGSRAQTEQILHTTETISEMARSIQDVSENANVSARVAQQAVSTARHGNEAVRNTIQGMQRIRVQVQETSKRIKHLGESSQEIGEIVQLIQDITDRTSILALNASIQAAMAGESGRGFALVAEEVERLAERSAGATRRIAELVRTIQMGTSEAISAMEESTREVVEGSHLANQAGQSLDRIETVSNNLAEVIQTILQSAREQARNSEEVTQAMQDIADITQQTAAGAHQSSATVSELSQLADELRASVSSFRLSASSDELSAEPMADADACPAESLPDSEGDEQS
ncbi:MAG: methyl-accepting chemotaxis protein [Blastocatellia bacterium]